MTNHAPMTPEQAREYLKAASVLGIAHYERRALETIAGMGKEVEYRIVDPDTNGGRYEMRRWVRGVTEWRLYDE